MIEPATLCSKILIASMGAKSIVVMPKHADLHDHGVVVLDEQYRRISVISKASLSNGASRTNASLSFFWRDQFWRRTKT